MKIIISLVSILLVMTIFWLGFKTVKDSEINSQANFEKNTVRGDGMGGTIGVASYGNTPTETVVIPLKTKNAGYGFGTDFYLSIKTLSIQEALQLIIDSQGLKYVPEENNKVPAKLIK